MSAQVPLRRRGAADLVVFAGVPFQIEIVALSSQQQGQAIDGRNDRGSRIIQWSPDFHFQACFDQCRTALAKGGQQARTIDKAVAAELARIQGTTPYVLYLF
jgi:hypothetical protein